MFIFKRIWLLEVVFLTWKARNSIFRLFFSLLVVSATKGMIALDLSDFSLLFTKWWFVATFNKGYLDRRSTDVTCRCRIWFGCARIMPVSGLRQASFHSHGHGNSGHWNDSNIKIGSWYPWLNFLNSIEAKISSGWTFCT